MHCKYINKIKSHRRDDIQEKDKPGHIESERKYNSIMQNEIYSRLKHTNMRHMAWCCC